MAGAVLSEAALSFLGLGVPPPAPSWGTMIEEARDLSTLQAAPHALIFPGVAIALTVRPSISSATVCESIRSQATGSLEMDPAISISNLSKTYPVPFRRLRAFFRRPVKDPVEACAMSHLTFNTGEIFGLIGRNGAGKTRSLRLSRRWSNRPQAAFRFVATTASTTTRTYAVRSVCRQQRSEVFTGDSPPNRTFLMFFARLHGLSDRAAKQRTGDLFSRLELDEVARRRFGELSTGNKQRLAVARALLSAPPVLLLSRTDTLARSACRGAHERADPFARTTGSADNYSLHVAQSCRG